MDQGYGHVISVNTPDYEDWKDFNQNRKCINEQIKKNHLTGKLVKDFDQQQTDVSAIFINCVLMAFPNGIDPSIEITFNTIYTVEMLLKIMARGFIFHTYAYLRDPWNWLDFIVVIVGYLTMIPALSVLPGASVIRVLRALRMITALEGLKAIVNALFKSFRMLADVFCLALFILIIFALIGVQLFMGILTQKCCRPFNSTGDIVEPFTMTKFKNYVNVSSNWYFENGDPVICGNESSARHCPVDYLCYQYAYPNPNDGFTSFDNFPVSLLVSFQLITLDNWEDIYNKVNDAIDSWCIIYFIPVVLLGAFYVMNLVIAIVAMAYNKEDKILQDQKCDIRHMRESYRNSTVFIFFENEIPKLWIPKIGSNPYGNGHVLKIRNQKGVLSSRSEGDIEMNLMKGRNGYNEENFKKLGKNIGKPEQIPKGNHIDQGSLKNKEGKINIISLKISAAIDDPAKMQPHEGNSSSTKIENTALDNPINENRKTSRSARYSALSRSDGEIDRIKPNVVSVSHTFTSKLSAANKIGNNGEINGKSPSTLMKKREKVIRLVPEGGQSSGSATVTTVSIVLNAETTSTKSTIWRQIRVLVGRIVDDSLFELFITGCIILNTVLMSMYQPLEEYNSKVPAQNIDNYVFTCIFTTEMTLKLIAFGFTGYIQSKWNVFDGIVVIISLVDLLLEFISISSNSLSVLRTLRLLRVFKLARSWTTMRRLLSTIVSGAKALLYILLILILTIYVFAVLGMKIFRDAYRKHFENLPRWNFDDFIDSFMMIFRILCGEWIEPLYDAIQATNISSILFFLAAYVVGKLLVLHLFLALLLSSFENQSFQEAYSDNSGSQKNNGNLYDALRYLIVTLRLNKLWNYTFARILPQKKTKPKCPKLESAGNVNLASSNYNPQILQHTEILKDENNRNGLDEINTLSRSITEEKISTSANNGKGQSSSKGPKLLVEYNESALVSDQPQRKKSANHREVRNTLSDGDAHSACDYNYNQEKKQRSLNQTQEDDSDYLDLQRTLGLLVPDQIDDESDSGQIIDKRNYLSVRRASSRRKSMTQSTSSIFDSNSRDVSSDYIYCETPNVSRQDSARSDSQCTDTEANNSVGMKAMSNTSCNGGLQYSERSISQPIDCFPKVCMKRIPYCIQGETSLCQAWMTVRSHVKNVVEHRFFEGIILLLIVASSISLVLYVSNIFFAAAFSIEMILKLIGIGVHGYICSPWNILDAAIVVVSIITLVLENVSAFRSLRVLRALRPLRAISHWEGMRAVVNALFGCIPHITNVIIVCAFFWLVFCVGGVNFFGGKFYKCLDLDNNLIPASIISNKTDCLANNYIWKNSQINFDSVPQAFLALFEVATFEGWIQVMGDAVDAREIDQQPIPLNNKSAYIYFVAFIIIGSFFSLNLIVSVIIDCFYALKQKSESGSLGIPTDLFMTESQKRWYNVMKTMSKSKPVRRIPLPKRDSQKRLLAIVQSNKFELAIILVIVANTAAMMVVHFDQSQEVTRVLDILFFTSKSYNEILVQVFGFILTIYVLEAILKIIAMRQHYFKNLWNLFDFIIVLVAIIGIILDVMDSSNASIPINPSMLRTLRLFRIVRILRVLEFAKGIRKLLTAFAMSMPALFNVALLVFLVMFIYAIVGMSSFAYVKHQTAITKNMNFETFPNGLLLLFRLSTSAGWNDVLHDLMVQPPDCNNSATAFSWNGDCGNPPVAITFLITYIFITTFVLINMYVAIILNNYQEVEEEEEGSVITAEDINVFYETWAKYDPEASQFISFRYLSPLVAELKPPLRIPQPNKYPLIALDLALYDSRLVHCLDVLEALVERVIGQPNADEAGDVVEEIKRQIQKKFSETFPSSGIPKQYDKSKRLKQLAVQEIKAAVIIQRAYRHYRLRKACKEHCQRMRRQSVIHL
ncbi:Sodium channel protein 60E [Trichoplax sp. H2]|nr:Sodium channel protein 60E [Trichoplax sp. H2]|eukprot:RDD37340.1 Sodium channel protein 60E [Trichoplax sp. H2]